MCLPNNSTYRPSESDLLIIIPEQSKMKEFSQIEDAQLWNLSYESCRRCGGTLTKYSLCAVCRQAMQHICVQCGFKSEGMLHRCHLYLDVYQTRDSLMDDTHSIVA